MLRRNSAVAGQQRWFLTTRAAWQLIQLLWGREAIDFRLLVDNLRRRATARVLHGGLGGAWLVVTGWTAIARVFATGLAITRCAVTRAAAFGRWGAGGTAAAVAWAILTCALWLTATRSACARALCRSTWTAATALGRLGLGHIVNAVTEVIHIIVEEFVRGSVGGGARWLARLALFARRAAFTGLLLTGRAFATAAAGGFSLPLSLPLSRRPPPPPPPFGPSPFGPRGLRGLRTSGRSRASGFSASTVLASKPIRSPSAIFCLVMRSMLFSNFSSSGATRRWLRPSDPHGRYDRYGARNLHRRSAARS